MNFRHAPWILAAALCAGGSFAQQTSTPESPAADSSGPKAGAPDKMMGKDDHKMQGKKSMSSDKAAKPPMNDPATSKKPAKAGAQSGAASAP